MTIWVDADSCPVRVREIISRAAIRRELAAVFVAVRKVPLPEHPLITFIGVPPGEGEADMRITQDAGPGDIVVTRDIPLAADIVEKGVLVLNDRGEVFTGENIRERLSVRNFMKDLRQSGLYESPSGGYGAREIRSFSDAFDREITKFTKKIGGRI
jgi:uncharacterized protein YaiI (UPF0178 family)